MPDISTALADNRAAVDDLIAAAERSESVWTTPRAPGKWSPSQVVEHIAINLEEAANVVADVPTKFPSLPRFVRPLVRLLFRRILRTKSLPKAKTPKPFDPAVGPASPAEGRSRLDGAAAKFDEQCRACAERGGEVKSTIFGSVGLEDYVAFNAVHVRHHIKQMPSA